MRNIKICKSLQEITDKQCLFLHHEVQEGSLQPHPLTMISANICSTKQDGSKVKNKKLPLSGHF